jgi:RNA polymerase sigma-70 factor (ECF subfamily)
MEEAVGAIWERFHDRLKAFILSRIRDRAAAEDLLQEVFIKIHSSIDSLRDESKLQSWVYQIARNAVVDYLRSKKTEIQEADFQEDDSEPDSSGLMTEALQDMARMMNALAPEDCEALCLTELGGMSQAEYARQIGISYSGAKSRVQRAKNKLRDMMMKCCHYQFDKYGTVIDISPLKCCCCR